MRIRILAALLVVGAGIVATAWARQGPETPPPAPIDPGDRAKLRAEVIRLTAEVELLQLDHEAEWSSLLEALRSVRQSEMLAEIGNPEVERLGAQAALRTMGAGAVAPVGTTFPSARSTVSAAREQARKAEERRVAMTRAYVDRKKKDFARHAAELAGKRLDLAEAQRRYDQSGP